MPGITHLQGSHDRRFPCFERPALPCPTSTFRAFVKQVKPSEMSASERNFLNAALGGFLTGAQPPGHVHALLAAATPHAFHEDRLPRRYDGDRTLPHGRYYTVCENAEGDDSGTLRRELLFYKSAQTADGHFEVYDPALTEHREMIRRLGMDATARGRIVIHFIPFAQPSDRTVPFSLSMSIPIEIQELCVDNVLDLRRPAAINWLFHTVPSLRIGLNDAGETQSCFPCRPQLTAFGEILPSLLDQSRGGGNFDKLVGLYLRQIGISGLVFPSARTDAYTYVVNGEPSEFHGWSFVDYRDAPEQEIVAFFELRPEWPRTLVIEGGDDHEPRLAPFAEEFQIHMTENFPSTGGTLAFRGLAQRIEAYHMVDSLEAAARFRLGDLDEEAITTLKTFAVSLGSRDARNFAAMVLHSLLGLKQAQDDLQHFVGTQLGKHPIASVLTRCANPPPADGKDFSQAAAFRALFEKGKQEEKHKE
jgi:hypothetical protein